MADLLGIAQSTLCNIESGETKKIDFFLLLKICKEFKIDLEYFMNETKNEVNGKNGVVNVDNNTEIQNLLSNLTFLVEHLKKIMEDKMNN